MSSPYNPPPGGQQPGEQPQWGGYPGGANYPQQEQQPGQSGQGYQQGGYQQGGYQQGGYSQGGYSQGGYQQPSGYQQGGYQQSGYQQGNYPQQQGGYSYQQQSWSDGRSSQGTQSLGFIGLAVAAVGAILLIIGVTALKWYSYGAGADQKFSDIHKDLNNPGAPGLSKAYFGWMAWVLLILVVLVAVAANLPIGSGATILRIVAPVLGIIGLVLTLVALNSYFDKAKDAAQAQGVDVGLFKHSAIGLYLTLAGFLIAGVAGVFGPRRG